MNTRYCNRCKKYHPESEFEFDVKKNQYKNDCMKSKMAHRKKPNVKANYLIQKLSKQNDPR